jgi:hypothetical protein
MAAPPHIIHRRPPRSVVGCVRHTKPKPTDKARCMIKTIIAERPNQTCAPQTNHSRRSPTHCFSAYRRENHSTLFFFLHPPLLQLLKQLLQLVQRPFGRYICGNPGKQARLQPCLVPKAPSCSTRALESLSNDHGGRLTALEVVLQHVQALSLLSVVCSTAKVQRCGQ